MKIKEERYEFYFDEQINSGGKEGLRGIVIDISPKGQKPMTTGKPCLVFMSEDKGEIKGVEQGHIPFGYIQFRDLKNLRLAQQGLEMIQAAIFAEEAEK